MERSASIPAWVSRRSWGRNNPVWVRRWLERKPKGGHATDRPVEPDAHTATILQFPMDRDRT